MYQSCVLALYFGKTVKRHKGILFFFFLPNITPEDTSNPGPLAKLGKAIIDAPTVLDVINNAAPIIFPIFSIIKFSSLSIVRLMDDMNDSIPSFRFVDEVGDNDIKSITLLDEIDTGCNTFDEDKDDDEC